MNKVELFDYMGSDKSHALAAWASTFLELDLDMPDDIHLRVDFVVDHILKNSKRIRNVEQLLEYLGTEAHTSPFRFSMFHFAMTIDIATHIHLLKHAVAVYADNAESARYKVLKDNKFYLPYDWNTPVGLKWSNKLKEASEYNNELYLQCYEELVADGMSKARAKETSRYFKMYNTQLNVMKMISFDGFVQIYKKRNLASPSQREVALVLEQMKDLILNIEGNPFEYSMKAFNII